MSEELKPCQFCGADVGCRRRSGDERDGYADRVSIFCTGCGVMMGAMGDTSKGGYADNSTVYERAVAAWNRRALESASQPGGGEAWQPIETAPKTGRTLLLGYLNRAGNWRTVRGQWMSSDYIDQHWEDPDDPGDLEGWYETSVEADDTPNCWHINPTHWMPLPAAPSAGNGGAEGGRE